MSEEKKEDKRPAPDSAGTSVKPTPKTKPSKTAPKPKQLPPYKVLLHNDDKNEMTYVINVIRKLTGLTTEAAFERMMEAHLKGVSLLLVTHKERAELYVEQFASCSLTATMEPDAAA